MVAVLGGVGLALAVMLDLTGDNPRHVWWVLLGPLPYYLVGLFAFVRRPDNLVVRWLLASGSAFAVSVCLNDSLIPRIADTPAGPAVALASGWVGLAGPVLFVGLVGLFPVGRPELPVERRLLWALGTVAFLLPVAHGLASPTLLLDSYPEPGQRDVASPWHVPALAALAPVTRWANDLWPVLVAMAFPPLAVRYRRSPATRRPIRLLLGGAAAAVVVMAVAGAMLIGLGYEHPVYRALEGPLWLVAVTLLLGSLLIGLFHHGVFGIDVPFRRRRVLLVLRSVLVLVHGTVTLAIGFAAARFLPVNAAVFVAVAVALVLQPVRGRLGKAADVWVFGARLDGYQLLSRFGEALDSAPDPAQLVQELADTVRRGLDLVWARVRLTEPAAPRAASGSEHPPGAREAADDHGWPEGMAGADPASSPPAASVPVRHGGAVLGRIDCGPRRDGTPLVAEDRRLLDELAAHAATAVHNIYLTGALSDRLRVIEQQAAELAASRERVVQGQDAERRRIQRDLHDGVQQEVVALSAKLGLARAMQRRGDPQTAHVLADLHDDMGRLLRELREFAHTIHPPVLADRGLLSAVEAQAARLPVAMTVHADPGLRAARFPPDVEATAWYGLAEALSNVVKHAHATTVTVSIRQPDGRLELTVADDGHGFTPGAGRGLGLAGLADRLDTLGGDLCVETAPGHGTTVRMEIPLIRSEPAR
jgi:signal transduction histidine kinase